MSQTGEFTTRSLFNVPFYKITNYTLNIGIRGARNALIILADKPREARNIINIGINDEHKKSWIAVSTNRNYIVSHCSRTNIIVNGEFRTFWLTWMTNKICFGEPHKDPMMVYDRIITDELKYVGFASKNEGSVSHQIDWRFEVPLTIPSRLVPVKGGNLVWLTSKNGIPENAIIGGTENGSPLYVIRSKHRGSVIPGKYSLRTGKASIGYDGTVQIKDNFEFLCGYDMQWVKTGHNPIPPNAFVAARSSSHNHDPIYIGRAGYRGKLLIGQVNANNVCYLPHINAQIIKQNHEILCHPLEDNQNMPIIVSHVNTVPVEYGNLVQHWVPYQHYYHYM